MLTTTSSDTGSVAASGPNEAAPAGEGTADTPKARAAALALQERAETPFYALPLIVPEEEARAFHFNDAWAHIAAIEPRAGDDPFFPMHFHTEDDLGSQSAELRRSTDSNLMNVAWDASFSEFVQWENKKGEIETRQITKPGYLTLQSKGTALYVLVNESCGNHRRRNKDIVAYRAIFCEHDNYQGKSLDELIASFPLRPSLIIVSSSGKFHFYWFFTQRWPVNPETEELWRALQLRLVEDYGGDEQAKDPARVLRVAGSLHLKRAPWRVRIVENNGLRYGMADLVQAFKPVLRELKPQGDASPTDDPDVLRYELAEVTGALFYLQPGDMIDKGKGYDIWTTVVRALRSFFGDLAFPLFHAWSMNHPDYSSWDACWAKWTDFADKGAPLERATTIKSIYKLARQNGWKQGKPRLWNYSPPEITIDGASRIVALPAPAAAAPQPAASAPLPPFQQPLPAPLLPVEPFALDLLPEPLQKWAGDLAYQMQTPADFVGVAAIIALGTFIGSKIGVRPQVHSDWTMLGNLYGMAIGDPGLKKSAPIEEVLKPVQKADVEAAERYKEAVQRHSARKTLLEARLKDAEKNGKKQMEREPYVGAELRVPTEEDLKPHIDALVDVKKELDDAEPVQRQYYTSDATPEALVKLFMENPYGFLLYRDELKALFQSFERNDKAELRQIVLEAWSGSGFHKSNRVGRGAIPVSQMCLSIVGSIQPGVIARHIREAQNESEGADGLLQRFQITCWPDTLAVWKRPDRPMDYAAKKRAYALFEKIEKLTPEECGAHQDQIDGKDHKRPYLRFSPEAQALFDAWQEALHLRIRNPDSEDSKALKAHLHKYEGLPARLALILHLAEDGKGPVSGAAMQKALRWMKYLESHARRLYASGPTAVIDTADAIRAKLMKGTNADGFSANDIRKKGWAEAKDRQMAEEALDLLESKGWLTSSIEPRGQTGRPPVKRYAWRKC